MVDAMGQVLWKHIRPEGITEKVGLSLTGQTGLLLSSLEWSMRQMQHSREAHEL